MAIIYTSLGGGGILFVGLFCGPASEFFELGEFIEHVGLEKQW